MKRDLYIQGREASALHRHGLARYDDLQMNDSQHPLSEERARSSQLWGNILRIGSLGAFSLAAE